MCGRFTLTKPPDIIARHFSLDAKIAAGAPPRYNIAPTQNVYTVRCQGDKLALSEKRWGLIPSWSHDPSIGPRLINARAETVSEKPAFRDSFQTRRCLVPADGFYEWKGKQPWHIWRQLGDATSRAGIPCRQSKPGLRATIGSEPSKKWPRHSLRDVHDDTSLFAFAGLWDAWRAPHGAVIESCTIITTPPNQLLAALHDRMPAILAPDEYQAWLRGDAREALSLLRWRQLGDATSRAGIPSRQSKPDLRATIGSEPSKKWPRHPCPAEVFRIYPVSPLVSRPENDGPACREPLPESATNSPPLFDF